MAISRIDFRDKIPVNIVKGARLETTVNDLFNTFEAGEQRNAELVNRFFDQTYFRGEESLIDKLVEVKPDIKFDDIEKEGINLAILQYNNWIWDFRDCLNKITNDNLKNQIIEEIHDKIQAKLGGIPTYGDFNNPDKCQTVTGDTNVLGYFQKVLDYLTSKEGSGGGAKRAIEILQEINITNKDLNDRLLATGGGIPLGVNLTDTTIPVDEKNTFDTLLSFEIGKEADRTINIAKDISRRFQGLLTNTFPAINTIIGESSEYKYDESKLGDTYRDRVQALNNDASLSDKEKKKQVKNLKWEYYLIYLKSKNAKIGNALQQLYENDFDYSALDRTTVLKDYLHTVADIRLRMLFDNGLNDVLKVNFGNLDDFESFYKDLADPTVPTIKLKDVNIPGAVLPASLTGEINIPVQKKIAEGRNEWLKDIDEFGKNADKSYDVLPIEYIIKKSDLETHVLQKITMEDKEKILNLLARFDQGDSYVIKGAEIGNLIYLFFVINSNFPITEIDFEKQKEIEDLFGKAENPINRPSSNEEDDEESSGNLEDTPEKFKEIFETLGPGKFENGSEIWIPIGKTELPGGGYQWMKVKISDVNMTEGTFKGTVFGGELKFSRKFEGKSREFKMNQETLDFFKGISKKASNSEDKVWLQPNPDISNFNSFREGLHNKLGTDNYIFPPEGTSWDGNKFIQTITDENGNEKEVEVKYFGASSDDKSTYKIEYNPIRKSFTVSSTFNGEEKGNDGKSEKKRFSYKRDMDWNNFLIFFTQKGLTPQTEEESKDAIQRQDQEFKMVNGSKWTLNWFSLNNLKSGFKDIFGTLKKKIDEYDKSQTDKFKGIVEGPLLNALSAIPLLPNSIKYALGERQQELYNDIINGSWKKIERYLKALQTDGQFADTFDQVPYHLRLLRGSSYKEFITNLEQKINNGSSLKEDEVHRAAALLLANYEKGGSPFRGLSEYENKGLWVKILLGKDHYNNFMRCKAACIRDRDLAESSKNSGLDKKGLNEQLATCEMDYIINNVRGAYPKLSKTYFPSFESRGINGDDSTNYIPNPSKQLLSEQFANKLEDAKKGRYTKASVEETYGKNKSFNRFEVMEDEFGKMGSTRYKQGAGALRRMFDLAADESLKKRAKRHFLTYLLSGALDVNCDPGLKKQVYGWAKPMSFVPGMLVKEAGVAENIAILLDDIEPKGDFSRHVTKYFHRNGQLKGGVDFKGLQNEIKEWLTDKKMEKLDDYFSKLPTNDFSSVTDPKKKTVLQKFKKSLIEEDVEEFDRGLLDNPKIVNNGLLTNINVVSDRLRIEDGEFKGKDSDDINNKKEFWKNIKDSIGTLNESDPKTVDFVLNKYFTRFGLNSSQERQNVYKRINTAYFYKRQVDSHGGLYIPGHKKKIKNRDGRFVDEKIPVGKIDITDIDKILLYGLEGTIWSRPPLSGKILPKELKDALDAFQKFFESAFSVNTLNHRDVKNGAFKLNVGDSRENDRFLLGGWDVYQKIARKDDSTSVIETEDAEYNGNFSDLKESEQKKIWRSILRDDDLYINPHMENIEKALKRNRNVLAGNWRLTTFSDNEQLLNLQESLNTPDNSEGSIAA